MDRERALRRTVLSDMQAAKTEAASFGAASAAAANAVLPHFQRALNAARRYAKKPTDCPHEHKAVLHMHYRRIAGLHQEWLLAGEPQEVRDAVTIEKLWILEGHWFV